ncbi:hypothetical protein COV16_06600 [Candidatus Woesearchaeota archaeon CG10_big_fil_rev_8_21_14_0_10_34_8]|nr:MAG: hypothetical protein COV16_06600 [Candidatus Woesearchaeota archaeon CG10_big_fil_rev_8_21_14_0_10_34_8]
MANEEQQVMRESRIPTDKVLEMRSQGLSNNQIIQTLQRSGYDLTVIFNAMNQADIKSGIDYGNLGPSGFNQQGGSKMDEQEQYQQEPMQDEEGLPDAPMFPGQSNNQMDFGAMPQSPSSAGMEQPMDMNAGAQPMDMGMGSVQPMGAGLPSGPAQFPSQGPMPSGYETQRIEELAEAIIDEKWNEIVRSINKIIDWKERVEARVNKMDQQMEEMQKNFDRLHKGIISKIGDYDQNIQQVGAEIKAMEKVFQKVLPTLTENVSELSRLTDRIKKK